MEFNTPFTQLDEKMENRPRPLLRLAIKIIGAIAIAAGLLAAVILLSQSPAAELQVLDLSEQQRHIPSTESQISESSLVRATSVYMFNDLMKSKFVSDVPMLANMQPRTLFHDFLATIGSQAPLASGQMRRKSDNYTTAEEYSHRFEIFQKNLLNIILLNAKEYARNPDASRARFAITVHADWTEDEFKSIRMNMKATNFTAISEKHDLGNSSVEQEEDVNAIECSQVTTARVRDQGVCGSCWAFSATEQLRYSFFHKYKKDSGKLSVQYLLDCMPAEAPYCFLGPFLAVDSGCCGGLPIDADKWIESNGGIPTVDEYGSYLNGKSPEDHFDCRTNVTKALTPVGGVKFLHSETEIANGYCNTGSVSIGIVANDQWMFYAGGMMDAVSCPAGDYANHAVLVVGIDRFYFDTPAYVVQNSWGKDWGVQSTRPYKHMAAGDNGFMLFRFGNNTCGIKTMAIVPSDVQPASS
mmetsp:Transcript_61275/g.106585  ORF Transcript_61275/g.106585 Transcript_61275/m.106585 type:complete len:469 (+) Transcript_61275:88-1494(+)